MRSPPILSQADQDPEVQAAEARAAGERIIRNHLDNHLAHNSGASSDYISWIATLHPENAQVEIDERFFIPGNPWWSIYEETVNMPYATAVPVPTSVDEEAGGEQKPKPQANPSHVSDDLTEEPIAPPSAGRPEDLPPKNIPHYCLRCNPVDMLVGLITTFQAILLTFIFELIGLIFYFVAAFFYNSAQALGPNNIFTGCFYSFFMVMYFAFATADSALLLGSVIGTETCIFVGWVLGCLFGGIWVANKRHQFVRSVCHRIRWAFRNKNLEPPRIFCKQQTQVGTELEHDNEQANAELDKEFEIDGYEANDQHYFDAPSSSIQCDYEEETRNYAHAQPKDDIEQKSARPY